MNLGDPKKIVQPCSRKRGKKSAEENESRLMEEGQ